MPPSKYQRGSTTLSAEVSHREKNEWLVTPRLQGFCRRGYWRLTSSLTIDRHNTRRSDLVHPNLQSSCDVVEMGQGGRVACSFDLNALMCPNPRSARLEHRKSVPQTSAISAMFRRPIDGLSLRRIRRPTFPSPCRSQRYASAPYCQSSRMQAQRDNGVPGIDAIILYAHRLYIKLTAAYPDAPISGRNTLRCGTHNR